MMRAILTPLFLSILFFAGCAQKESHDISSYQNDSASWQQFKAKNALDALEREEK